MEHCSIVRSEINLSSYFDLGLSKITRNKFTSAFSSVHLRATLPRRKFACIFSVP
jgi:hypothetical protein